METSALPAAPATQPSPPARSGMATSVASDFNTFLRMLTTQMKNQDPLSPLEANDFAIQLATFSMVEQQVTTNNELRALNELLATPGVEQMAHMIGDTVLHTGPFRFSGSSVRLEFPPEAIPNGATLLIKNEDGVVVDRASLNKDQMRYTWAGKDRDGLPYPVGNYTAEVKQSNDAADPDIPVYLSGQIDEVLIDSTGLSLVMSSGSKVAYSDLAGVR